MQASQITAVYSPHGDGLRSLVACHLALAGQGPGLLVDLAAPYPALTGLLDATPTKSWLDLLAVAHELSPDLLDRALTPCQPHGHLLAAPGPDESGRPSSGQLQNILSQAKERFKRIVLDLSPDSDETLQAALGLADVIYLLVRADITGLRQGSQAMAFLDRAGQRSRVRLLLAATALPKAVTAQEVETFLGPVAAILPWDPIALTEALNLGTPLMLRSGPLRTALQQLASGQVTPAASQGAGWSRATGLLRQAIKSATGPRPIPGASR